jgi:transcriptional regulator with XRE-family HTH domain
MSGIDLKCERIKANIPQYKLAAQLGITQTELSAYENERRLLSPGVIEQIQEAIKTWKNSNHSMPI